MITKVDIDTALNAICINDEKKIIEIAMKLYNININENMDKNEKELVKNKFYSVLMNEIENNRELNLYLRKEAKIYGKFKGELWGFIINYSSNKNNIKHYIQNYFMYCKDNTILKKEENALIEKVAEIADFETLIYCINNKLIKDNKVESLIGKMNKISYINWFITHRKEYEQQVSLDGLISMASRICKFRRIFK